MKESEIIYSVIYNLKKIIEEGEDKILELRKDAKKNEREKADLKVEVSKLTGEVSVSLIKYLYVFYTHYYMYIRTH